MYEHDEHILAYVYGQLQQHYRKIHHLWRDVGYSDLEGKKRIRAKSVPLLLEEGRWRWRKKNTWVIKIWWIIVIDYGNLWTRITLRSWRWLIYWTLSWEALFWRWKLIVWRSCTAALSLPLIPMQNNGNSSLIIHNLPRRCFIMKFQGMNRLADDFWYGRYC